jgi:uncharacterized protein YuzE
LDGEIMGFEFVNHRGMGEIDLRLGWIKIVMNGRIVGWDRENNQLDE